MKKKNLKELRENKGLTQEQVAKITGKTITFISLLENGRRNASDKTKIQLAKLYGCEIADIFLALQLTKS